MLRGKEERLDNSTDNEEHIDMEWECKIVQMKIEKCLLFQGYHIL